MQHFIDISDVEESPFKILATQVNVLIDAQVQKVKQASIHKEGGVFFKF